MSLSVCPAAVVAAPVAVVWANLVQWERYADWADVRAERREPEGPASAGQTVTFAGNVLGCTLRFTFKVEQVDAAGHELDLHVVFPFGLQEKPHIACRAIDATICRVQYG